MIILNDAQLHGNRGEESTIVRGEGGIGGNMEGEVEVGRRGRKGTNDIQ